MSGLACRLADANASEERDWFANNGGRRCPYGTDGWVIADGCPVHCPRAA